MKFKYDDLRFELLLLTCHMSLHPFEFSYQRSAHFTSLSIISISSEMKMKCRNQNQKQNPIAVGKVHMNIAMIIIEIVDTHEMEIPSDDDFRPTHPNPSSSIAPSLCDYD